MVLFDNIEIGNLDKTNPNSAATIKYVDDFLPDQKIYIKSSRLGIGISDPNEDLDVSGTIQAKSVKTNLLTVWNPNNTANQDAIVNINVSGSTSGNPFVAMNIANESDAQWSLGIDNTDNLFKIKSSQDFSGTGRLVLSKSGYLGIGVQDPKSEIHLSNNINNKKVLLYDITGNNHQYSGFGTETNGGLRYQVNQSGVDHIFYSGSSSTSSVELMRIKGDGKVGINESNPTARLTVNTGNVDEYGLSLITTSSLGKGAGVQLDNRGNGGRMYNIYSRNNGMLNFEDQLSGNRFLELGHDGSMVVRAGQTGIFQVSNNGMVSMNNDLSIFKPIGDTKITVSQNNNNSDRPRINLVKGTTGQNEWSMNVDNSGNFLLTQLKSNGSNVSNNILTATRSGVIEISNLNIIGKVKEDGFDLIPVGTILSFAGSTEPNGYLICDGRILQKPNITNGFNYNRLFQVIGITYGGDANNFRLPDLRCRVPIGSGMSNSGIPLPIGTTPKILGSNGGTETHTLTVAQMPSHIHTGTTSVNGEHTHGISTRGWDATWNQPTGVMATGGTPNNAFGTWYAGNHSHDITTTPTGSNQPHPIMQPYLVINYIIKY